MKPLIIVTACLALCSCARRSAELTAVQHERAAEHEEVKAQEELNQYDPDRRTEAPERGPVATREPFDGTPDVVAPPLAVYNPTVIHRDAALEHERSADSHFKAAKELEQFENIACEGVSAAQRAGCPLLTPKVEQVEETASGVKLHLKAGADAHELSRIMGCHLAFAKVHGYDARSCPLYMVGVTLQVVDEHTLELKGASPGTASDLRAQARLMFHGAPKVSARP
jgi:hypothetical protein